MHSPSKLREITKGILLVMNYFMLANVIATGIMLLIFLLVKHGDV